MLPSQRYLPGWFPGLLALLIGSCATLPENTGRTPSNSITDTAGTRLALASDPQEREHPGDSGFVLLSDGLDAFAARVALTRAAESSLDLQYYLYHKDMVGTLLTYQLVRAANRGVRVRLLLDDMDTAGRDGILASLDAHPNIEIRLFNPFSRDTQRASQLVTRFGEVTRRMHNKSFTADHQVTIIGGRNIGDEYFSADPDFSFGDLDVMAVGPVVDQVAESFDLYWNHALAYPVSTLVGSDTELLSLELLQSRAEDFKAANKDSPYVIRLKNSLLTKVIKNKTLGDFAAWGTAQAVYDSPDKLLNDVDDREYRLSPQLKPYISGTREELVIFAAYFVPGKKGLAFFRSLRERGVRVRVLTNSLASTDVAAVHSGYSRYRKALLESGVELYEVKPNAPDGGTGSGSAFGSSRASLHAKAFVMDRRQVFVGSFNLDPRSNRENTEIGIVFESPQLADVVADLFDDIVARSAYRLSIDKAGRIRWHDDTVEGGKVYSHDPETSWFKRTTVGAMRLLPIESQL